MSRHAICHDRTIHHAMLTQAPAPHCSDESGWVHPQVLNAAKLIKCTQSYAEEQESMSKHALADLAKRMAAMEAAAPPTEKARQQWAAHQEQLIQVSAPMFMSASKASWHGLCIEPLDGTTNDDTSNPSNIHPRNS